MIQRGGGAYDWLVEDNEIRRNGGVGIAAGPGWLVIDNYVHHQGQLGVAGSGDAITYEGNEIAFNNTDNLDPGWEAGGSKFVHTTNLVLRDNYVHDNKGPGLWLDGNNIYALYEGNRIVDNYGPGIDHEISYDAVIRNNWVEGNGFGVQGWIDGAGILIGDSSNVQIYDNTVLWNNDGIAGKHTGRGSGDYGPYQLKNLWVHDNVIAMEVGQTGVVTNTSDPVFSAAVEQPFRLQHLHPRHRRQVLRLGPLVHHHQPMASRRPRSPQHLDGGGRPCCTLAPARRARRRLGDGVSGGLRRLVSAAHPRL